MRDINFTELRRKRLFGHEPERKSLEWVDFNRKANAKPGKDHPPKKPKNPKPAVKKSAKKKN